MVPAHNPTFLLGGAPEGIFTAPLSTRHAMATTTYSTSTATAEHYVWGTGCHGWHLVRAAGLSVIEERMPRNTSEVRHWHARARQFFYVLSGTLTMEVEGVRHQLGPRAGMELSPGTAHQAINEGADDVEFLVVSMPPSHGDRHEEPLDDAR